MAKRKHKSRRTPPRQPAEDRRAEAVTVAWMLCVFATLLAEVAGGAARLLLAGQGEAEVPATVLALPGVLLFSALVTGTLSLILLPLTYLFRRSPPPAVITTFAITVAVVPLLICLWQLLQQDPL